METKATKRTLAEIRTEVEKQREITSKRIYYLEKLQMAYLEVASICEESIEEGIWEGFREGEMRGFVEEVEENFTEDMRETEEDFRNWYRGLRDFCEKQFTEEEYKHYNENCSNLWREAA